MKMKILILVVVTLACFLGANLSYALNTVTVPTATITIDGDFNDWSGLPIAISDAAGDVFGNDICDLFQFYISQDSQYIYLKTDLVNEPGNTSNDLNIVFAFMHGADVYDVVTHYYDNGTGWGYILENSSQTMSYPSSFFAISGNSVENKIALSDLKITASTTSVEMYVHVFNMANGINDLSDTIEIILSSNGNDSAKTWYSDSDGDGYGNSQSYVSASSQPTGYVSNSSDCDDNNASVYPSATEISGDNIDQDCDGTDDSSQNTTQNSDWILSGNAKVITSDSLPNAWQDTDIQGNAISNPSCDTGYFINNSAAIVNPFSSPNMIKIGNQTDSTNWVTDNKIKKNFSISSSNQTLQFSFNMWSYDYGDFDRFYVGINDDQTIIFEKKASFVSTDSEPPTLNTSGWQTVTIDLTPWIGNTQNNFTVWFAAGDTQDTCLRTRTGVYLDNISINSNNSTNTWYPDGDGDGYGNYNSTPITADTQPYGYTADYSDCDDSDATIYPGANEITNDGVDQNCDGKDSVSVLQVEEIFLLSPKNNETLRFGNTGGKIAFSFSKLLDASFYVLYMNLNDILNDNSFNIPISLTPPGNSSNNPWGGGSNATPGFLESFIGMVYELSIDQVTWDVLSLYDIEWGVEAYDENKNIIASSFDGSSPQKFVNSLKFIASNSISMISPTLGEELSLTDSAPAFKWDAYQGVSTYTLILAHVGSLGFDSFITKDNLTLNLFPMSDSTWQTMPTGTWYWTIFGYNAIGSPTPSGFTIFDFEVQ